MSDDVTNADTALSVKNAAAPHRRREFAPLSGEEPRSLEWLTRIFGFDACFKTFAFGLLAVGSWQQWPFVVGAADTGGGKPSLFPFALFSLVSAWLTYGLLRQRRRSAVLAAGIPLLLAVFGFWRSPTDASDWRSWIFSLLLLGALLRNYKHLD